MAITSDSLPNLPLSEQTFYILVSLATGPRHGYAILKDIQSLSGGRLTLSVSTLYTTLKRLLEQGWIERVHSGEEDESGRPRKEYQLTQRGKSLLSAETQRLRTLVQAASLRLPGDVQ